MPKVPPAPSSRGKDPGIRRGVGERYNSKGEATRQSILLTAERLFAEHGIAAVPLRDIGAAAGQKNSVAVQYHFGNREGLLRAITTYRTDASDLDRSGMLASLLAKGRRPTVSDLVKVFVHPMARHLDWDNHYLAFLSRYIIERGGYSGFEALPAAATVVTVRSLISRLMPSHPQHVLEERWMIVMTCTVHTLARYQTLNRAGKLVTPPEDLLADLERYLTAGLEAPYDACGARPQDTAGPGERRTMVRGSAHLRRA